MISNTHRKINCCILLSLIIFTVSLSAQSTQDITLSFSPDVMFPLGESATLFGIGGGGDIHVNFALPWVNSLSFRSGIEYNYLSIQAESALSEIAFQAGLGYEYPVISFLSAFIDVDSGYYLGIIPQKTGDTLFGTGFMFQGGGGVMFNISPGMSIKLGAVYKYDIELYSGVKVFLTTVLRQGRATTGKANLEIQKVDIKRIFPVFYKYYDANALGSIKIKNIEPGIISDVQVGFYVNQFMERPKLSTGLARVGNGEIVTVPLFGLFKDDMFSLTEETAVSGEIVISYVFNGEARSMSLPQTVYIASRNSLTWDDDRKAVAFVQAKDPGIIKFGRNAVNAVKSSGNSTLNEYFRSAVGIFTELKQYGVDYVPDPTTPYQKISRDDKTIDFLQFPWQTLEYKSGDCDDMSILYTSLLESAGIEAAFITVPGHIYSAFKLGLKETDIKKLFLKNDDFIFINGDTWVPVETTMLSKGFASAWKEGARQWREQSQSKNAVMIPIRSAWELYKPVGFRTNADKDFQMPASTQIAKEFGTLVSGYVDNEIRIQTEASKKKYKQDSPESQNWLGVINYRLGNTEKARGIFKQLIASNDDYIPSLVNIGNIEFLEGNYNKAEQYYRTANTLKPENAVILIGLAKTLYQLERMDDAKVMYNKVASINSELAKQNVYIISGASDTGRAADQTTKSEGVSWLSE